MGFLQNYFQERAIDGLYKNMELISRMEQNSPRNINLTQNNFDIRINNLNITIKSDEDLEESLKRKLRSQFERGNNYGGW